MTIDPLLGRVLDGRYRLDAPLGGGGFGAVYVAWHLRLARAVAVKVLHPEHVRNPELRKRFEREAKSLAALSHPNVVTVFDYGVDEDLPFLVMEKLEGRPLAVAIAEGLAPGHAIAIAIDVASALAYAHAQGIVHRDLKPANIFLQAQNDGTEGVRVLDFGLAKFVGRAGPSGAVEASGGREDPTQTHGSSLMGTPAYMSPEQATGDTVDARADVYTLGLVLYESVTGKDPYAGSAVELIHHQLQTPLPAVVSSLPGESWAPALDKLLAKATAKERDRRFADGGALRDALLALADALPPGAVPTIRRTDGLDGSPSGKRSGPIAHAVTLAALPVARPSRPWLWGGLAALVLGGVGAAVFLVASMEEPEPVLALGTGPTPPPLSEPLDASMPDAGVLAAIAVEDAAVMRDAADEPDAPSIEDAAVEAVIDADAIDPWSRGVPVSLRRYRDRPTSRALTRRDRTVLARWARANAEDCRGQLAWGHALMNQGARTEALEHYRAALAIEATARNDPRLRTNLLRIAAYDGSPREGADLAVETYGDSLVPDIDAFLATLDPADPDGRRAAQRLRTLRTRAQR